MGFGGFDRDTSNAKQGTGSLFYLSGSHAAAVNQYLGVQSVGRRLYAGPARPAHRRHPEQHRHAVSELHQHRHDAAEIRRARGPGLRRWKEADSPGGLAGTDGILHSGIGPFDIDSGTVLSYAKVNFTKNALKVNFFTNILNGSALNLLAFGPTGEQLGFDFKSKTFDFEVGNVSTLGSKNVLTYGGNFRQNLYDLTIAPEGDNRTEGGAYAQDEFFISKDFRIIAGARVDKFDNISSAQFSPRAALMVKPSEDQTVRVLYNRAFRAPSVINNYLDTVILDELPLDAFARFFPPVAGKVFNFPIAAAGDRVPVAGIQQPELKETEINVSQVKDTGIVAKRATVTAAWFLNETKNDVYFTQVGSYRATNQPPGWSSLFPPPLNFLFIESLYCAPGTTPLAARPCPFGAGNGLPSAFSYVNFGTVRQKGLELGVDGNVSKQLSGFVNYCISPRPRRSGSPPRR